MFDLVRNGAIPAPSEGVTIGDHIAANDRLVQNRAASITPEQIAAIQADMKKNGASALAPKGGFSFDAAPSASQG